MSAIKARLNKRAATKTKNWEPTAQTTAETQIDFLQKRS
jgi:hypothetical protein